MQCAGGRSACDSLVERSSGRGNGAAEFGSQSVADDLLPVDLRARDGQQSAQRLEGRVGHRAVLLVQHALHPAQFTRTFIPILYSVSVQSMLQDILELILAGQEFDWEVKFHLLSNSKTTKRKHTWNVAS